MQILFENKNCLTPKVSIILLDWSCRESFHSIDYLNKQTIPREQYEIIWIEYYGRIPEDLKSKVKKSNGSSEKPLLDKWIVMAMPDDIYYHKHLMYNAGIIVGKGDIICICDSDAVFSPTFVESVIKEFKKSPDIVLHLDEVRNIDKKFYPFNYPSIDKILGSGVINWNKSKSMTTGLLDKDDYLHSRNYGACFCARKTDLIAIGGADEHMDYLGHICGPYELTFRLINYGLKEIWLSNEFIYHTWHPGTDGHSNYAGLSDGRNMSLIALDTLNSSRVMPLLENNVIGKMRLSGASEYSGSLDSVINQDYFEIFKTSNLVKKGACNLNTIELIQMLGFYEYNIIKANNEYYGVPQNMAVNNTNFKEKVSDKDVIKGKSIKEIKAILKQKRKKMQNTGSNFKMKNFIKGIPILGSFARWIYRFIKMPHYMKYLIQEISDIKTINYQLLAIINRLNSEISSIKREINKNETGIPPDLENETKKR